MSSIPSDYNAVDEVGRILGIDTVLSKNRRFRPNGTRFYPGAEGEPIGLYEGDPIDPSTFNDVAQPSRGIVDRCVDAIVRAFRRIR